MKKMVHPSFYGSTRNDAYFLFWKLMTAAARRLVSGLALAGLPPWEAPARPIRMAFLIPEFRGRFAPPPPILRIDHLFALCYKGQPAKQESLVSGMA